MNNNNEVEKQRQKLSQKKTLPIFGILCVLIQNLIKVDLMASKAEPYHVNKCTHFIPNYVLPKHL